MHARSLSILLLASLALLPGCEFLEALHEGDAASCLPLSTYEAPEPRPSMPNGPDDLLALIARDVPGFGGYYRNAAQDTLFVYLTTPTQAGAEAARDEIARRLIRPSFARLAAVPVQGQHGYDQLYTWFYQILQHLFSKHPALDVQRWTMGIAENANRVDVSPEPGVLTEVEEALNELCLPPDAVVVTVQTG